MSDLTIRNWDGTGEGPHGQVVTDQGEVIGYLVSYNVEHRQTTIPLYSTGDRNTYYVPSQAQMSLHMDMELNQLPPARLPPAVVPPSIRVIAADVLEAVTGGVQTNTNTRRKLIIPGVTTQPVFPTDFLDDKENDKYKDFLSDYDRDDDYEDIPF